MDVEIKAGLSVLPELFRLGFTCESEDAISNFLALATILIQSKAVAEMEGKEFDIVKFQELFPGLPHQWPVALDQEFSRQCGAAVSKIDYLSKLEISVSVDGDHLGSTCVFPHYSIQAVDGKIAFHKNISRQYVK